MTATWDRNPEPDIASYILSYGTQSGSYTTSVDVGNVTSWQLNLSGGFRYYFVIQAKNTSGLISPRSAEVFADIVGPATPIITSLSPSSGSTGTPVTITGANFGATPGTSTVRFNGTAATPTSWSASSIGVPVPSGATTGNVVVTVGGVPSNGAAFQITAPSGLPAPWISQDIGGPALAGSATYAGGTFSVAGAGADIWDTSDQFRFVYQPIDGDVEVVARVASVLNTDDWAKGGVMIREDLTANARNAMALVSAGQGFTFQRRVTRGDASTFNGGFGGMAPQWVRLVRSGTTISGYYSATGTNWVFMGSDSIPMPTRVYVGLAVTSHNTSLINNATLTNVTVTGGSPSPPPPAPPSISTLSPTSGSTGTPVTITGANFGATPGTSTVRFNGTAATPTSWSASSIGVPVPSGATTGNVVVTVGGVPSNGAAFQITAPSGLPAPWISQDIGGPALAGSATYAGGTFSVAGAGADIWDTSDQFRFVYQPIDGDVEVVARVASVLNTDDWAKGGVMIREDLTANARNAMALVSAGQGFTFQRRVTRGDASTFNGGFGGMAPQWVRLVRSGTTISGYYSATGTNWVFMGSDSIPMPTRVYVGLAVTSHNASLINNVTLTNVTVTGGSPSPPPPAPPSISTLSPSSGSTGTPVTITGANFGATPGTSTVRFNGTAATPTSWSASSISVPVPSGATTGNVVVTVGGVPSNGAAFQITAPSGLPAPWISQDIGGPALAGSATYAGGTFSVAGAGADIWDTSDQFRFVYQPIDGDVEVVARVASVLNTDDWAKGGVMIREDLTANARNAMALVSAGQGFTFQRRVTRGDASTFNGGFGGMAPQWVRLVRSGTTISGYYSATGTNWVFMGSDSIPMPTRVYIGLAVTSHNASLINNVTLTNVTVTGGSPSPPPPAPPSISTLSPTSGSTGTPVTITGANFGATPGTSTVRFNGTAATPTSWSASSISVPVPSGATTGNVVVTVGGVSSNGAAFRDHRPVRIAGALDFAGHRRACARRQRDIRVWHVLRVRRRHRHLGHKRSVSVRLSDH